MAFAHPLLQVATIRAVPGALPLRPSLSSLSSLADRCGTHYRPVSQVVPRLDTTPGERDAITDAGSELWVAANSCTAARPRGVRLRRALRRLREEQDRVDTTPPLPRCALRLLPVREATRAHRSPHATQASSSTCCRAPLSSTAPTRPPSRAKTGSYSATRRTSSFAASSASTCEPRPALPPPGSRLTGARRRRRNASIRTRMCEDANFNGMVRESAALRQGDERPATSGSAVPGASLASRGRSTGR